MHTRLFGKVLLHWVKYCIGISPRLIFLIFIIFLLIPWSNSISPKSFYSWWVTWESAIQCLLTGSIYKDIYNVYENVKLVCFCILICVYKISGIIFTSPRTVKAVAISCRGSLNPKWKELPSFALGERTAAFAKGILDLDCQGSSSGCGYKLAKFITEHSGKMKGFYSKNVLNSVYGNYCCILP